MSHSLEHGFGNRLEPPKLLELRVGTDNLIYKMGEPVAGFGVEFFLGVYFS